MLGDLKGNRDGTESNSGQDGDDADDHEEFDEGETEALRRASGPTGKGRKDHGRSIYYKMVMIK
jgi:hypothetical protein